MARDPSIYTRPEVFDPTRFLGSHPEQDPAQYVYGFGRRFVSLFSVLSLFLLNIVYPLSSICPGTSPQTKP